MPIEKEINIEDLGIEDKLKPSTEVELPVPEKKIENKLEPLVDWKKIDFKDLECITYHAPDTSIQGDIDGTLIHALQPMEVIALIFDWRIACSAPNTLDITKCASGVAPDSGNSVLASTIALNSAADTPLIRAGKTLTATLEHRRLKYGDRLCISAAGSNPAMKNFSITLYFKYLNQGNYRTGY